MFREEYWKHIIFGTDLMMNVSFVVLSEIGRKKPLDAKKETSDAAVAGWLHYCFAFMLKWLQYYRKFKETESELFRRSEIVRRNFEQIVNMQEGWSDHCMDSESRPYYWPMQRELNVVAMIDHHAKRRWKELMEEQQCQRLDCTRMRGRNTDWQTCSSCYVAVYCSRKCAKYDWKYGCHRKFCKRYAQMLSESKNVDYGQLVAAINHKNAGAMNRFALRFRQ